MITLPDTRALRRTHPTPIARWVAGCLLLISVVVFWVVWAKYAVNIPKWDDHVLKLFLFNVEREPSIFGKINQFFIQHNEHRIVYDRLITWLDYTLFGKLNYVHLMAVGNLSLFGLLVIFGLVLGRSAVQSSRYPSQRSPVNWADGLLYLPPVAFLLLNLSQWENMFWGMAALQNFTVLFWVVWVVYLLSFTRHFGAALFLAIVATLTSGNGILVWPVGLLLLILQAVSRTSITFKSVLIWVAGATLTIGLYFLNYAKPPSNPPIPGSVLGLIKGWLAFNGSAAEAFSIRPVVVSCVLLGGLSVALILGICLRILLKQLSRFPLSSLDYFFLGIAAFLIGTSLVVAWTRTGYGLPTLLTSRYKPYSLLMLALLYTYLVTESQQPAKSWMLRVGVAFSALLMASSYLTYLNEAIGLRHYLLTSQFNWSYQTNQGTVSADSVSSHYLTLAPAFYDTALPTIYGAKPAATIPVIVQKTPGGYEVSNSTLPALSLGDQAYYLLLRSAKRTYLLPVRQNQSPIRRAIFQPDHVLTNGFRANVSPGELDADRYQLFIFAVSDGAVKLYATNQSIESAGPPNSTVRQNW